MLENNKTIIVSFIISTLIILSYFEMRFEEKLNLIWEDITVVGDTLKEDLDEIKQKLDDIELDMMVR